MSMNSMHCSDLRRTQADNASVSVFGDIRKGTYPRIEHPLVLLRRVSGRSIAELWVSKPRTVCYVDQRCCAIDNLGRDDSDVVGRNLVELGLRRDDEDRFSI
jgi:hypothetical protein